MGDRLATIYMGRKGCCCAPFYGGELRPHPYLTMWPGPRPNVWGCAPFCWGGGAGSPSNTMLFGSRPTSISSGILILPAVWPQQTWAENWGLCPLFVGAAEFSSNTMWPELRSTSMPSCIHPAIWPQYTNVTDKTDRTGQTDNGLIG